MSKSTKGMSRRQFLLGGSAAIASAAALGAIGMTGCSNQNDSAAKKSNTPTSANGGTVDTSKACTGQDTPNLATLEESIDYNQIDISESEKSAIPTISQDTIPYLHINDYGKSVDLQMEILTPSTAKAGETPLVVWINGGGFTASDPAGRLETRLAFAKAGYVVASIQHATSATSNFPTPLQNIKAGIRFLKANAEKFKFCSDKVAVGGNSSGGYYATMVGVTSNVKTIPWPNKNGEIVETPLDIGDNLDQSSAVNSVIDYYGVSDLTIIGSASQKNLKRVITRSHHRSNSPQWSCSRAKGSQRIRSINGAKGICCESVQLYLPHNAALHHIPWHSRHTCIPCGLENAAKQTRRGRRSVERTAIKDAGHGTPEFDQNVIEQRAVDFLDAYVYPCRQRHLLSTIPLALRRMKQTISQRSMKPYPMPRLLRSAKKNGSSIKQRGSTTSR